MRGINHSIDWSWSDVPMGKGGGSGGGSNTVVQQSGPPAQVLQNYENVFQQAQNVAGQPYPTYGGSLIAGFTPQQIAGFNNINTAVNAAQPFLNAASQYTTNAANLLSPGQFQSTVGNYQNPGIQPYLDTAQDWLHKAVQWYQGALPNYVNFGVGQAQGASTAGQQYAKNSADIANNAITSANNAVTGANQWTAGLAPSQIGATAQSYMSPYIQDVINATQRNFNEGNAEQLQQVRGNAIGSGAFGGDREAVAEAETARMQQLAQAPVIAGLQNQGYQAAIQQANQAAALGLQGAGIGIQGANVGLGAAGANTAAGNLATQAQLGAGQLGGMGAGQLTLGAGQLGLGSVAQEAALGNLQQQSYNAATQAAQANAWLNSQAGFGMGSLGNEVQNLGLQGANAQINAGGLQQQLAQQELNVPYQQWLAAQGYPFQVTNWLEGMATGTGALSGTQGSTTYPGPSTASQLAGLGLAGAGLVGSLNQAGVFSGWGSGGGGGLGGPSAADLNNIAASAASAGPSIGSFVDASGLTPIYNRGGEVRRPMGGAVPGFAPAVGTLPWDPTNAAIQSIPDTSINVIPQPVPGMGGPNMLNSNTGSTSTTSGGGGGSQAASNAIGAIGDVAKIAGLVAMFANRGGGIRHNPLRGLEGIKIPRRQTGGASPAVMADTGLFGGNPQFAGLYSQYAKLPTEQLRELAARMPNNPLIQRAIQYRNMSPQSDPSMQQPGLAPTQTNAAPGGYAGGGEVGDESYAVLPDDDRSLGSYIFQPTDNLPSLGGIPLSAGAETPAIAGLSPSTMGNGRIALPQQASIPLMATSTDSPLNGPLQGPGNVNSRSATPGMRPVASNDQFFPQTSYGGSAPVAGFAPSVHERPTEEGGYNFLTSPWSAMMAAGLGMMSGTSPYAGVNIGRGGLEGLQFYERGKALQSELGLRGAETAHQQAQTEATQWNTERAKMIVRALEQATPGQVSQPQGGVAPQEQPSSSYTTVPKGAERYATATPAPESLRPIVEKAAQENGVPLSVANWLFTQESHWDPFAKNLQSGASGIAQFMPATAKSVGVADPMKAEQAIPGGLKYLKSLYDQTGNWEDAIARYGTFSTGKGQQADAAVRAGFRQYMAGVQPSYQTASNADVGPPSGGGGGVVPPLFNVPSLYQQAQRFMSIPDPQMIGIGERMMTTAAQFGKDGIYIGVDGQMHLWPGYAQAAGQIAGAKETGTMAAREPFTAAEELRRQGLQVAPGGQGVQPIPGYSEGVSKIAGEKSTAVAKAEAPFKMAENVLIRAGTPLVSKTGEAVTSGFQALPPELQNFVSNQIGIPPPANIPSASTTRQTAATAEPFAPSSSIMPGVRNPTVDPGPTPPASGMLATPDIKRSPSGALVTTLPPGAHEMQNRVSDYIGKTPKEIQDLREAQSRLVSLQEEIQQNANQSTFTQSGFGAELRTDLGKAANMFGDMLGVGEVLRPEDLANNESFIKTSNTAAFALARTMAAGRVALGEVLQANRSTPNLQNTVYGNFVVNNLMLQENQRQIDRARYMYQQAVNGADPQVAADKFDESNPTWKYVPTALASAYAQRYGQGSIDVLRQHAKDPAYIKEFDKRFGQDVAETLLATQ